MAYKDPEDQRRYARAHYRRNKAVYKARARKFNDARRKEIRAMLHEAKAQPCVDCGIAYLYYVMQFDHARGEKLFTIGNHPRLSGGMPIQRIVDEMAKCDIVCGNCHAERTHQRRKEKVAGAGLEPATFGL